MYLIVGVLTPIFFRLYGFELTEKFGLIFSPRTDVQAFGNSIERIKKDHVVMMTKISVYDMISGLYLAVAILHFCIVWFGLRQGNAWSLWSLTLSNVAIILFFLIAARNFSANVTPLRFSDLAPYALLPAFILPFAVFLGWIGLR